MKKCCVCKMPVPPKAKQCPVCGKKYTKFEYFRINWLSRVILILIAAFVLYNVVSIILFNREIRGYIKNPPENPETITQLKEKYERLSVLQKGFVHYSELENISDNAGIHEVTKGDDSISVKVYSQNGSIEGEYKGELIGNVPDGVGELVFYDENGLECTYEGEFKDGKIQGAGEMRRFDGEVLKGTFFEGLLNGYGKIYNADGTLNMRGTFVNNRLNGYGVIYDKNGSVSYEGEFIYGLPEKQSFIQVCTPARTEDIEKNVEEYIGKNVEMNGMLTDISIGEDLKQYYIFSQDGDDEQRFMIINEGEKVRFNLWENYTIYGCCESVEEIKDSRNNTTTGARLKAYYIVNG